MSAQTDLPVDEATGRDPDGDAAPEGAGTPPRRGWLRLPRPARRRSPAGTVPGLASTRLRRSPAVVAASVLAVCLGGLLGAWAYTSASDATEVVAVRAVVLRGEVIDRADLVTVRVGVDPALQPVPAADVESLVGRRAALDLAAGSLVTADAVAQVALPAAGMSVVGVALQPGLVPEEPLLPGDKVRVVATPGDQGDVTTGKQRVLAATVVGVHPGEDGGTTVVDVQLPFADAPELAARAATGRVALVLDSRER